MSDPLIRLPRDMGLTYGIAVGANSLLRCVLDRDVHRSNFSYLLRVVAPTTVILYSVIACTLLPVVLALFLWAPGLLLTTLSLVPLWALHLAQVVNPRASAKLFADGLRSYDPDLADYVKRVMDRHSPSRGLNIFRAFSSLMQKSWRFITISLLMWSFSIVPILGSLLTLFGQTYLVVTSLSQALIEPYLEHYSVMPRREKQEFYRLYRWVTFGFALPWLFILSVPFVGPFFIGIALAGSSDLYMRVIRPNTKDEIKQNDGIAKIRRGELSSVS